MSLPSLRNCVLLSLFVSLAPAPSRALGQDPGLTFAEANGRAALPRWLALKWGEFDTSGAAPAVLAELAAPALVPGQRGYFVIQPARSPSEFVS